MGIQHPALITGVDSCAQYLTAIGIKVSAPTIKAAIERNPSCVISSLTPKGNRRSAWDPAHLEKLVREITGFDLDLWLLQQKRNRHAPKKPKPPKPKPEPGLPPMYDVPCPVACGARWKKYMIIEGDAEQRYVGGRAYLAPYVMRNGAVLPLVEKMGHIVLGKREDQPFGFEHGEVPWEMHQTDVRAYWPDVIWRLWTHPEPIEPTAPAAEDAAFG